MERRVRHPPKTLIIQTSKGKLEDLFRPRHESPDSLPKFSYLPVFAGEVCFELFLCAAVVSQWNKTSFMIIFMAKGKRIVNHIYLPSFNVEWNWEWKEFPPRAKWEKLDEKLLEMNVYDVRSFSCFESLDRCFNINLMIYVWCRHGWETLKFIWGSDTCQNKNRNRMAFGRCWFEGEEQIFESQAQARVRLRVKCPWASETK